MTTVAHCWENFWMRIKEFLHHSPTRVPLCAPPKKNYHRRTTTFFEMP